MPGRNFNSTDYRYGFNGQEKTDEISGSGNHTTAMFWEYDTRLGRRWNQDPKPNPSISNYAAFANNPIWFSDPLGDTLQISGVQTNKFLRRINRGSKVKFKYDGKGNLVLKNPNAKIVGEFATQMVAAINDNQTVVLDLVKPSDQLIVDAFRTGEVDNGDMFSGTNKMFKTNLIHFVVERFDVADYEKNKTTAPFTPAHQKAIQAEEAYLQEQFPSLNVSYQGEGFDNSSLKYNKKKGTGTINLIFDYGDVKQVFKMEVVKDPSTGNPTATGTVLRNKLVKTK